MILQFLEDWLSKDMSRQTFLSHRQYTLDLLWRLGCLMNWEKSELEPTQIFEFVGITYNLKQAWSCLHKRSWKESSSSTALPSKLVSSSSKMAEVDNITQQSRILVPWGRIHLRIIQLNLNTCWSPQKQPQSFPIKVWDKSLEEIKCWTDSQDLFKGYLLHPPEPQITLCTDSSMEGWGPMLGPTKCMGHGPS